MQHSTTWERQGILIARVFLANLLSSSVNISLVSGGAVKDLPLEEEGPSNFAYSDQLLEL